MANAPAAQDPRNDKSNHHFAYGIYAFILLAFVSVCTIAIIATSQEEAHRSGFRPITTASPMSFVDKTYVKPETTPKR